MSDVLTSMLNDRVMEIRMNRPAQMNAISVAMLDGIEAGLREAQNSRAVRAVVLTGEGRGFCAGADLASTAGPGDLEGTEGMGMMGFMYKYQERIAQTAIAIHECDKPVISAVNGAAVGGGLAFALASDLRVARRGAKFGSVFIKIGLSSCDIGCSYFLPRLIPPTKAMELMITGRIFLAEEADELGMLNALTDEGDLQARALQLADAICENSEYGVWMTKKGFWNNLDASSLRQAMEIENRTQILGTMSGATEEAMAAFAEGRAPEWKPL